MRLIIFLLATSAFAADPKPQPIAPEDTAIVQGLVAGLQAHQQQVNAAVAKQEARICKEHKIKRDVCFVDWQHGTVSVKPKDAPRPAEKPAK
jgi:hypothetical protein